MLVFSGWKALPRTSVLSRLPSRYSFHVPWWRRRSPRRGARHCSSRRSCPRPGGWCRWRCPRSRPPGRRTWRRCPGTSPCSRWPASRPRRRPLVTSGMALVMPPRAGGHADARARALEPCLDGEVGHVQRGRAAEGDVVVGAIELECAAGARPTASRSPSFEAAERLAEAVDGDDDVVIGGAVDGGEVGEAGARDAARRRRGRCRSCRREWSSTVDAVAGQVRLGVGAPGQADEVLPASR